MSAMVIQPAQHAQPRVLHHNLGGCAAWHVRRRHAGQCHVVAPDKGHERFLISATKPLNQLPVTVHKAKAIWAQTETAATSAGGT